MPVVAYMRRSIAPAALPGMNLPGALTEPDWTVAIDGPAFLISWRSQLMPSVESSRIAIKSAGERCAMTLVIAGISVVWSGIVWVAATSIWG
jgi:hypothetical protein